MRMGVQAISTVYNGQSKREKGSFKIAFLTKIFYQLAARFSRSGIVPAKAASRGRNAHEFV
jgi:hypothetical protein